MSTFANGRVALNSLADFLNLELATTHEAEFYRYYGAPRCLLSDDLPSKPETSPDLPQAPYAILRLERDDPSRIFQLLEGEAFEAIIRVDVKANESTGGAIEGEFKGDTTLGRVLTQIISSSSGALREAGFARCGITGGAEQTRTTETAEAENNDLLRVNFTYIRG
jgi:hypothetical protein